MRYSFNRLFICFFSLLIISSSNHLSAKESFQYQGKHSKVELESVLSKNYSYLKWTIRPDSGWHILWTNPGDTGVGLNVDWDYLPREFTGNWSMPHPNRIELGDKVLFGFSEELQLIQKVPHTTSAEKIKKPIKGYFQWTVCKDSCFVESTTLTSNTITENDSNFEKIYELLENELTKKHIQPQKSSWIASFQEKNDRILFLLDTQDSFPKGIEKVDFFPLHSEIISSQKPNIRQENKSTLLIDAIKSKEYSQNEEIISSIVVLNGKSYDVSFVRETSYFFFQAIAFAFIGGMLLNLMPCVFPILTMKAMSVVHASGMDAKEKRNDSLFYSMGILSFFWILYLIFIGIRAGGSSLGWGFQLQNPGFVFFLIVLFMFMGFQMMGWIEFSIGVSGSLANLTNKPGHWGSFFSGALAVVVATPCTAPFMGTALAYAFSEPVWVGLLIFTSLGIGMALPIALLQNSKTVAGWIPKPGNWMILFKEFLSFPLFLTAIWLLWVLSGISGRDETFFSTGGLIFILMLVWIFKNTKKPSWKTMVLSFIIAGIIGLGFNLSTNTTSNQTIINQENSNEESNGQFNGSPENISLNQFGFKNPINYSTNNLNQALNSGNPVFLYFTADWCVTCKYNEKTVFSIDSTEDFFQKKNILVVKADWTNEDETITQALEKFGRNGVPLYVYYPPGDRSNPKILPQILTLESIKLSLRD